MDPLELLTAFSEKHNISKDELFAFAAFFVTLGARTAPARKETLHELAEHYDRKVKAAERARAGLYVVAIDEGGKVQD